MSTFPETDTQIRITVAARTDVGRSREHNEDCFLVANLSAEATPPGTAALNCTLGRKGALLLVADGMGGASAGEVASRTAADGIHRALLSTWSVDPDDGPERFATSVRAALEEANRVLRDRASSQSHLRGMGTTTTLAGFLGSQVLLNQVGDSRAYLIRRGTASQLTRDQSIVQGLVDDGGLSEAEARRVVPKNVLLQALGPLPSVDVVQAWHPLAEDDVILLCSDGLWGAVADAEMGDIVTRAPDLAAACHRLIDLANERGGRDNITVMLARVTGSALEAPEEATP